MTDSKINQAIFRAYDIRGVYGKDITPDLMEKIGNAFASGFVKDTIVLGMDGRKSGPALKKAFIEGVMKAGKNVIDLGLVPRCICIFHALKARLPSAYITASHLTKEWNGVKFAYENGVEFFEHDNYKVRDMVLAGKIDIASQKGKVKEEYAFDEYKKHILAKIKKVEKKLKVVLDCGNGTGGLVAPDLFKSLGFDVHVLFGDVDGDFPNRSSAIEESTLGELKKQVVNADIGVAYDGDSDRMLLMDELGRMLGPEVSSHLILLELAKGQEGPIIANVECLKLMDEIAERYGRDIHRIRVGNSFLVQAVLEKGACFGVERSGHFCIPSIIPMDDGIAASMYAASTLSRTGKRLSEIVDELPQYPFKRINVECPDEIKFKVIENLKNKLAEKYDRVNTMDGVRVDFEHGWVLIRASNTGPVVRLSIEADDEKKLNELGEEFFDVLKGEIKKYL